MKKFISLICTLAMLCSLVVVPTTVQAAATDNVIIDLDFDNGEVGTMDRASATGTVTIQTDADGRKFARMYQASNYQTYGWTLDNPITTNASDAGKTYNISFDFRTNDITTTGDYTPHRLMLSQTGVDWDKYEAFDLLKISGSKFYAIGDNSGNSIELGVTAKADTWYSYEYSMQCVAFWDGSQCTYLDTITVTEIGDPTNTYTYTGTTRYNQGYNYTGMDNGNTFNALVAAFPGTTDIDNLVITNGSPFPQISSVTYYNGEGAAQAGPDADTRSAAITYSEAMIKTDLVAAGIVTLKNELGEAEAITAGGWNEEGTVYTVNIPELESADYTLAVSRQAKSADDKTITRKEYVKTYATSDPSDPVEIVGVKYLKADGSIKDVYSTDIAFIEIQFGKAMNPALLATGVTVTGATADAGEFKSVSTDGNRANVYQIPVTVAAGVAATVTIDTTVQTADGGILAEAYTHTTAKATNHQVLLELDFDNGISPSSKEYRMDLNKRPTPIQDTDGRWYMSMTNNASTQESVNWNNFGWKLEPAPSLQRDAIGTQYRFSFEFRIEDVNRSSSGYGGQCIQIFNNSNWDQKVTNLLAVGTSYYKGGSSSDVPVFWYNDTAQAVKAKSGVWYTYDLKLDVLDHVGTDTKYTNTLTITEVGNPSNTSTYTATTYNSAALFKQFEKSYNYLYFGKALGQGYDIDNIVITSADIYPTISKVEYFDGEGILQEVANNNTRAAKITYSEAMNKANLVESGVVTLKDTAGTAAAITDGGWNEEGTVYTVNIPEFATSDAYVLNVTREAKAADDNGRTRLGYTNKFIAADVINPVSVSGVKYLKANGSVEENFSTDVAAIEVSFAEPMNVDTLAGITVEGATAGTPEYKASSTDAARQNVYEIPVSGIVPGTVITLTVPTTVKTSMGGELAEVYTHVTAAAKNAKVYIDLDFDDGTVGTLSRQNAVGGTITVQTDEDGKKFARMSYGSDWQSYGWKFDYPLSMKSADVNVGDVYNFSFDFRLDNVAPGSSYYYHKLWLTQVGQDWNGTDLYDLLYVKDNKFYVGGSTGANAYLEIAGLEAKANEWYHLDLTMTVGYNQWASSKYFDDVVTITEIADPTNTATIESKGRFPEGYNNTDINLTEVFTALETAFAGSTDIDNLKITKGNPYAGVASVKYVDVLGSELAADAIDASLAKIELTFNKEMRDADLSAITTLTDGTTSVNVSNGGWSADKKTYTILVPENTLVEGTAYTLTVGRNALAVDGNKLKEDHVIKFVTAATPVAVEEVTYANESGKVLDFFNEEAKLINIKFNQEIDEKSIATGDITLVDKKENAVAFTGKLAADGVTYVLTLANAPTLDQRYTLKVSGVETEAGIKMVKAYEIEFLCETGNDILRVNYDDFTKDLRYLNKEVNEENAVAAEGYCQIIAAGADDPVEGNYARWSGAWVNDGSSFVNTGYLLDEPMDGEKKYKLTMKFASLQGNGYHGFAVTNLTGKQLDSGWTDGTTFGIVTTKETDGVLSFNAGKYPGSSAYGGTITTWERGHWYELEATFANGTMTAKITDLADPTKFAETRAAGDYDGFDKLIMRAAHIMYVDDIQFQCVEGKNSPVLFDANFNYFDPGIEKFNEQLDQGRTIKEGAPDGSKYLNYNPGTYLSNGWSFSEPMKKNGQYYDVNFDFRYGKLIGTGAAQYPLLLAEKPINDSNCYDGFGLLRVGADNRFYVGGMPLTGITYDATKWYSFDMTFNPLSKYVDVVVTEKTAPYKTATFSGYCVSGEWNYHTADRIPDMEFDCIKFTYHPNFDIDNIVVRKSEKKPVAVQVTSAHVGNIFDGDDAKTLNVTLENPYDESLVVNADYTIYDNNDNVIKTGSLGEIKFVHNEAKTLTVNAGNDLKYGTYKIVIGVTAETASMDDAVSFASDAYKFSVVNKVDYLNEKTAINIERINSMEEWAEYKEVITQAGISGVRFDLSWTDVNDGSDTGFKTPEEVPMTVWFEDAKESGIDIMAILTTSNPIAGARPDVSVSSGSASSVVGTDAHNKWLGYVSHAAETYGDYIYAFEIQNEPNGFGVNGGEFAKMYYKPANAAIKATGFEGKVVGFASAGYSPSFVGAGLEAMQADPEGPEAFMDAISIHPYDQKHSYNNDEYLNELYADKEVMVETAQSGGNWSVIYRDRYNRAMDAQQAEMIEEYGADVLGLEATEVGMSVIDGMGTPRSQAADIAQLVARYSAENTYDRVWLFNLENYINMASEDYSPQNETAGGTNLHVEGGWGLLGNYQDTVPLAAKDAYVALCGFNALTKGATANSDWTYISYEADPEATTHTSLYGFENREDGKDVAILWSEAADTDFAEFENISVNLGAETVEVYDMYSNLIGTMSADNGVFNFTAGMEPMYIVGDFTAFNVQDTANITIDERVFGFKGDVLSVNIADAAERALTIDYEASANLEVDVSDMEGGIATLTVTILPTADKEEEILVKLYDGENLVYVSKVLVNVSEAEMRSIFSGSTQLFTLDQIEANSTDNKVRVTIENIGAADISTYIIIAYYNDEGALVDYAKTSATFTKRGDDEAVAVTVSVPEGATQMKIMNIDAGKAMRPVSDVLYFAK